MSEQVKNDYIPTKVDEYVPWGNYNTVEKIIKSKLFYPTYINGLSGNGKTMGIMQACASLNRECIRVNITIETDESDLIGGWTLENGNTVWKDGPVVEAMKRGAVLLLDEIDLASHKIMCLQPILEGRGIYVKKINKQINHEQGFTIFATANTKGKGSDDGQFMGTNVLNEAFLDRFPATLYQDYPPLEIESDILKNTAQKMGSELGYKDEEFSEKDIADLLKVITTSTKWANEIRKSYSEGIDALDTVITTRRLVDFIRSYLIFRNEDEALKMILERFDEEIQISFKNLYRSVSENSGTVS